MKYSIELQPLSPNADIFFWCTNKKGQDILFIPRNSGIYEVPAYSFLHIRGESRHMKIRIPENISCRLVLQDSSKAPLLKAFERLLLSQSLLFSMESSMVDDLNSFKDLFLSRIKAANTSQEVIISLQGIGYKAELQNDKNILQLTLGKSHKIHLMVPANINIDIQKEKFPLMGTGDNQRISLKGSSLKTLNDFADAIRKERPPEVYKGKGLLIRNKKNLEKIAAFRKEGKKKKT